MPNRSCFPFADETASRSSAVGRLPEAAPDDAEGRQRSAAKRVPPPPPRVFISSHLRLPMAATSGKNSALPRSQQGQRGRTDFACRPACQCLSDLSRQRRIRSRIPTAAGEATRHAIQALHVLSLRQRNRGDVRRCASKPRPCTRCPTDGGHRWVGSQTTKRKSGPSSTPPRIHRWTRLVYRRQSE